MSLIYGFSVLVTPLNVWLRSDQIYSPFVLFLDHVLGVEVLSSLTERQQKDPGTPGVEGQHRANRTMNQEGGTRVVLWHVVDPSVVESIQGKVSVCPVTFKCH